MANELVSFVNDAYVESSGGVSTGGFCAVGNSALNGNYKGALRFTNIQIPQGTTINLAQVIYIYGGVGDTSGGWKWKAYGIDEDNTSSFSSNPFGRAHTSAEKTVDEGAPTSGGTKTLDVRDMAQEIVNRGGWSSGNAMGFLFENNGSDSNIYAFANLSSSYFVYRLAAEPDFTPTPVTVNTDDFPAADDWGMKVSKPGVDVKSATDQELWFTTKRKPLKVYAEGSFTTASNPDSIAHSLDYKPVAAVYALSGGYRYRLPMVYQSGGYNIGFFWVDDDNLYVSCAIGTEIYYYIFIDEQP